MKNSTVKHQTTFRKLLKGKIQISRKHQFINKRHINIKNVKTFSSKQGQISQQCSSNEAPIT
jgi:hypothetical protein